MAVLPIVEVPNPILRKKTKRVTSIDSSVKKLVANMRETLHAEQGRVGLAAPQVGVSLRITVICLPDDEETGEKSEDIVLINGEIVKKKGERIVTEGCLSIPGYFGEISRAESVTAKGLDINGKAIRIKGEGLLSQALEHEIDHLDGVLYVDHLESQEKLHKLEPEDGTKEQAPEGNI
ncbi:MAG: peptide deformylase [Dehalococcoidales bacterium]|nr:peptide deformylase [Dehalococcoidales bacterium]